MMRLNTASKLGTLATLLAAACAQSDVPGETRVQELDATGCKRLDICEVTQTQCQQTVLAAAACERDMEPPELPPVRFISREELRELLQEPREQPMSNMHLDSAGDAALAALHLLQSESSSDDAALDERARILSAFYDDEQEAITIVDGAEVEPRDALLTLAHELTHYLQHRAGQLADVDPPQGASLDERVARRALVEGEARLAELRLAARMVGAQPHQARWNALYRDLDGALSQEVHAAPSPIVSAYTLLPYVVSLPRLEHTWERENHAGIDALYASPAATTLFWFLEEGTYEPEPLDCQPPLAPESYELVALDRLGPTGVYALLATQAEPLLRDARDWRNDAIAIYQRRDTAMTSVLAVWRLRFRDAASAERFVERIEPLGLSVIRNGMEVSISVSNDPAQPPVSGPALLTCPEAETLRASLPRE